MSDRHQPVKRVGKAGRYLHCTRCGTESASGRQMNRRPCVKPKTTEPRKQPRRRAMGTTDIDRTVIGKGSTMIEDQTYYEPNYLIGPDDGSCVVFLYRVFKYRQASGKVVNRKITDVVEYTSEAEMVEAITSSDWVEGVEDGARQWVR